MNIAPGATYEAVVDWGTTGATLGLRVIDNAGATTVARLTTSITEYPAGSGIYQRPGNVSPTVAGQYTLLWDDDGGTAATGHVATEDLTVTSSAPGDPPTGDTYATVAELARLLKVNATTYVAQLEEVLLAATGEINSEIGQVAEDLEPWQLALASQVNIERAIEHWHARPLGFNVIGLDSAMPMRLARDSWEPYANKLSPLKDSWGLA